jgi:hypothetical protein
MKNLFHSMVNTGMVAALAAISIPSACANEGTKPGWRKGFSSWNGSSYDLAEKIPSPWETFETTNVDTDSTASDNRTAEADRKPYTVPEGPQSNPYYGSSTGTSIRESAQAEKGNPRSAPPAESFSDLFRTLVSPETDGQADNSAMKAKDTPPKLAAPDTVAESSKLSAPTNSATTTNSVTLTGPGAAQKSAATDSPKSDAVAESAKQNPAEKSKTSDSSAANNRSAGSVEDPPLQQEVIRWYQYPQRWMKGWDSHAEFGLDGSDGNADTLAIQTGLELKRQTDLHTLKIDIDYRQANSRNTTTENNGRLNVVYDRLIADSQWSGFSKLGLEWDQFKPFDLRINLNGGVGFHWIREDNASLVTRFGAGASREIGAPDDAWIPEALFGFDAERQLNARNKLKGKLDYFPSWEDFGNYRLVADAAWEILLDDTDNLSLKLAVTDRYDSTPQGAKPNDVYYSLLLLYKF